MSGKVNASGTISRADEGPTDEAVPPRDEPHANWEPDGNGKLWRLDPEDAHLIARRTCWPSTEGYVVVYLGRGRQELLHRLVVAAMDGKLVDHRDEDRSNNQRYNLRAATRSQNLCNRGEASHNTSGYKGVWFHKRRSKWAAEVRFDRKGYKLGLFSCPMEAARAYDRKAKELHGEFAKLNFPEELPE